MRFTLRSLLSLGSLLRIGLTIVATAGIWIAIEAWIGDRTSIHVELPGVRPIDLLAPQWLLLASVVPAFYLLRVLSLTDLSIAQQAT
jgi:hypothetical protein